MLATEFKKQLQDTHKLMPTSSNEEVQWINKITHLAIDSVMNDTIITNENDLLNVDLNIDPLETEYRQDTTNRTQLSDWLPSVEITEDTFNAITTNVENDCSIHVHPKKSMFFLSSNILHQACLNFLTYKLNVSLHL